MGLASVGSSGNLSVAGTAEVTSDQCRLGKAARGTPHGIAFNWYNNLNRTVRNVPLDRYDLPAKSTQIDNEQAKNGRDDRPCFATRTVAVIGKVASI